MTKRRAAAITGIITAAIFAAVSLLYGHSGGLRLPELPSITPGYYAVTKVVDGDTIEVNMAGKAEKVRLVGIDTPETHKPDTPVQCYGPEASDFAQQTLTGKSVRLDADPTGDNRDRYGRLLRYVYLQDGSLFQETLLSRGYAFAYVSFPFTKKPSFSNLETYAHERGLGLWGACQPTKDGERWQSNNL